MLQLTNCVEIGFDNFVKELKLKKKLLLHRENTKNPQQISWTRLNMQSSILRYLKIYLLIYKKVKKKIRPFSGIC